MTKFRKKRRKQDQTTERRISTLVNFTEKQILGNLGKKASKSVDVSLKETRIKWAKRIAQGSEQTFEGKAVRKN